MRSAGIKLGDFYSLTLQDLYNWCEQQNLESYRAEQIFNWQKKGISDFDQLSNIDKQTRSLLAADFDPSPLQLREEYSSRLDNTKKFVFSLRDGNIIESVLMEYRFGYSVCISSQAGCRMQCRFCASAGQGFGRDLTVGEMLAQVALINKMCDYGVKRVTVMGIGEPFDNYDNLVEFLKRLRDPTGLHISLRRVTVSTCGLVDKMIKFIDENLPITLSVSLHAPNQVIRKKLIPIAVKYPYRQLIDAGEKYAVSSGRRITYEYALFAGINDQDKHAEQLAAVLRDKLCHVNLIAANVVPGLYFRSASDTRIQSFKKVLEANNINVTLRRELGSDIAAACGQLRRSVENA